MACHIDGEFDYHADRLDSSVQESNVTQWITLKLDVDRHLLNNCGTPWSRFVNQESDHVVRVFLSCVTNEFRGYRTLLSQQLSTAKFEPVDQEHFADGDGSVLELVDEKIRSCDYVVHWIGKSTGYKPKDGELETFLSNPRFPDRARLLATLGFNNFSTEVLNSISYTQWEYWLGLFYRRRRLAYKVHPDAKREESFSPKSVEEAEQIRHIERIRHAHELRYEVQNDWNLSTRVLVSLISNEDITVYGTHDRPTIVLGLFPTGTKEHRSFGAIRWKERFIRIAADEPLDVSNAKAVCARLTELIGCSNRSFFQEELGFNRIVIELCLPEELLTKELSYWTHFPDGDERLGRRPIRDHNPVRVRWIERAKAQTSQLRIRSRLSVLKHHADKLHSICLELPPEVIGSLNPQPLALIRHSDNTEGRHWKAECVVCGGFVQPPIRLKRSSTRAARTLTEWQIAVMLEGVPYLIWPDVRRDESSIVAYLKAAAEVSSICLQLESEPVVVYAESVTPPFPESVPLISEVQQ